MRLICPGLQLVKEGGTGSFNRIEYGKNGSILIQDILFSGDVFVFQVDPRCKKSGDHPGDQDSRQQEGIVVAGKIIEEAKEVEDGEQIDIDSQTLAVIKKRFGAEPALNTVEVAFFFTGQQSLRCQQLTLGGLGRQHTNGLLLLIDQIDGKETIA